MPDADLRPRPVNAPLLPPDPLIGQRIGRAFGGLFMAGFGTVWLVVACLGGLDTAWPGLVPVLLIGLALLALGIQRLRALGPKPPGTEHSVQERARMRRFQWINAAQWTAIGLGVAACAAFDRPAWILPWVTAVIGLHFLPLAGLFDYPWHRLTGAALLVIALVRLLLGDGFPPPLVAAANGGVLWLSAAWIMRPVRAG